MIEKIQKYLKCPALSSVCARRVHQAEVWVYSQGKNRAQHWPAFRPKSINQDKKPAQYCQPPRSLYSCNLAKSNVFATVHNSAGCDRCSMQHAAGAACSKVLATFMHSQFLFPLIWHGRFGCRKNVSRAEIQLCSYTKRGRGRGGGAGGERSLFRTV